MGCLRHSRLLQLINLQKRTVGIIYGSHRLEQVTYNSPRFPVGKKFTFEHDNVNRCRHGNF